MKLRLWIGYRSGELESIAFAALRLAPKFFLDQDRAFVQIRRMGLNIIGAS